MNAIRKYYFPNLCITFTLVNVFLAVMKGIGGNELDNTQRFVLELAGFLVFIFVVDYYLEKIEFKNWLKQIVAEFIVNYTIFMAAAYLLNWFGFRLWNIIVSTALFLLVFTLVWLRTYKVIKQDEAWINRMLLQRKEESR
jgi:hypothetical protein